MNPRLCRFLWRGYERIAKRRRTYQYWDELEKTQWLPRAELERIQFQALRRLITHAFANCPYYRETWQALGLSPDLLRTPADFQRWPTIDRETIRTHRARMRAESPRMRIISKATGGSTGVPLQFDLDMDSVARRSAAWHRGYGFASAPPGSRQVHLWSVPAGDLPGWKRIKYGLFNWSQNRLILNNFELSDATAPHYLERLNSFRPDSLVGYSNSLYEFAVSLSNRGLRPFSPKSVVAGAEKLHDFQRRLIERVFEAPVFETYGSREVMLMAAECDRHRGMHLTMENLLLEVLNEDGTPAADGTEGDVVVTDLYNYGMPFVRYVNGDRAAAGWGTCDCRRGLPLLREVIGRRSDVIHTPDGRHITGIFFPHVLKEFPAIRRFVVVQDRPDHVRLDLMVLPGWSREDEAKVERGIGAVLGPTVRLDVSLVDDIPLTRSGKHPVVLNMCQDRPEDRGPG